MKKIKESDIILERGNFWVLDTGSSYAVMIAKITHSVSDSEYKRDSDGLSIAVARCNYLWGRRETKEIESKRTTTSS